MAPGGFSAGCQSLPNSQTAACLLFMVGLSFLDWLKCGPALADLGRTEPQLISGAGHVVVTVTVVVERPSREPLFKPPSQGNWEEKEAQTALPSVMARAG